MACSVIFCSGCCLSWTAEERTGAGAVIGADVVIGAAVLWYVGHGLVSSAVGTRPLRAGAPALAAFVVEPHHGANVARPPKRAKGAFWTTHRRPTDDPSTAQFASFVHGSGPSGAEAGGWKGRVGSRVQCQVGGMPPASIFNLQLPDATAPDSMPLCVALATCTIDTTENPNQPPNARALMHA